jgi:hypothetical protein
MPGLNGTGPQGLGPRTGRGLGWCLFGFGRGLGRGWGRGFGRWWRSTAVPSVQEEKEMLAEEMKMLKEEIKEIEKRLEELKNKK